MEWIKSVNEQRIANNQSPYDVISLYTEREPCGHASGNDCSRYIANDVEPGRDESKLAPGEKKNAIRVHYGLGFRRGELEDEAERIAAGEKNEVAEEKKQARENFKSDFNNYVNRVNKIWKGNAGSGALM
ncbi:hypothetical protein ADK70_32215 [Streptomyces rimosus subsp. pseudoverticillatus]|nr:hypothetical protein ADK70_32215 [Streptomyces rimosus subsp. pseudoverticillatus]